MKTRFNVFDFDMMASLPALLSLPLTLVSTESTLGRCQVWTGKQWRTSSATDKSALRKMFENESLVSAEYRYGNTSLDSGDSEYSFTSIEGTLRTSPFSKGFGDPPNSASVKRKHRVEVEAARFNVRLRASGIKQFPNILEASCVTASSDNSSTELELSTYICRELCSILPHDNCMVIGLNETVHEFHAPGDLLHHLSPNPFALRDLKCKLALLPSFTIISKQCISEPLLKFLDLCKLQSPDVVVMHETDKFRFACLAPKLLADHSFRVSAKECLISLSMSDDQQQQMQHPDGTILLEDGSILAFEYDRYCELERNGALMTLPDTWGTLMIPLEEDAILDQVGNFRAFIRQDKLRVIDEFKKKLASTNSDLSNYERYVIAAQAAPDLIRLVGHAREIGYFDAE